MTDSAVFDEFGMSDLGPEDDVYALAQAMAAPPPATSDTPPPAAPLPAATQQQQTDPETPPADEPLPVQAADGKSVIPHAVLREARDKVRRLEAERAELAATIKRLSEAQAQPPTEPPVQTQTAETPQPDVIDFEWVPDEEIAALEADFPEYAKIVRAQQSNQKALVQLQKTLMEQTQKVEKTLAPVVSRAQEEASKQAETEAEAIHDAIDRVPEMRWIVDHAAEHPDLFKEAIDTEIALRALPRYAAEPQGSETVFREVLRNLEAAHGRLAVPLEYQSPEHLKQVAADAVASAKPFVPQRMSDLAGGVPPEAGQMRLGQMDEMELLGVLMKHGPNEFARLTANAR